MTPLLVLVGPPGSGKTTVGRALAARLGVAFRDTDADIADDAGMSIPDIFVDHGEEHFRELEHRAIIRALGEHDGVLALGGGAVVAKRNRELLADAAVVFLSVELAAAVSRVGLGSGRPLLALNPRATMKALLDERRGLYDVVADLTVATDNLSPERVVDRLATWLGAPAQIHVAGSRPYDVIIGRDATVALPQALEGATRAALVYAPALSAHVARVAQFISDEVEVELIEVPDAEASKTVEVAAQCWDRLGQAGFTRNDVIIGIGGGAVTDLAGFVAACWLRGVRSVLLPTSVLGMVDAAVGGKTGVNTAAGKNLVGAFHPPATVLCDLAAIDTLPDTEVRAGMAEVLKCGYIADGEILHLLESEEITDPRSPRFAEAVRRAVTVKADVVAEDLTETGRRAILNYGHTLGHAIEKVEQYRWRHGDAVAVGMVFAAALARATGHADLLDDTRWRVGALGLPTGYRASTPDPLLEAMKVDKKAIGDTRRFVLLEAVGRPVIVDDVTDRQLRAALTEVLL